MKLAARPEAEHYNWGAGCDGWCLVKDRALLVIEEQMPPRTAEVRHLHERARQLFYVLDGEATFEHDASTHRLRRGESIDVLPGVPHQMRNDAEAPLVFLVISSPTTRGDRIDLPTAAQAALRPATTK